jgi:hypothetical protein
MRPFSANCARAEALPDLRVSARTAPLTASEVGRLRHAAIRAGGRLHRDSEGLRNPLRNTP